MVRELQSVKKTIDESLQQSGLRLFANSQPLNVVSEEPPIKENNSEMNKAQMQGMSLMANIFFSL
jgi:hypothetical protein